ncbi:hypothetical protein DAPPUDRAFT_119840 [Daphnia pulex]|uniref:Uncharacterized protein n=1 Tax=Daphnia pulex TaxID=6669 RepID=E9HZL9_DAPPU|nr:hypothetical protein DAPPUDRAFT_119840 [Daphnia pulex]|eukprot:EFX62810.1 hypothetical protein DAPPUDRAFT_119840 [Daphnia pulex]
MANCAIPRYAATATSSVTKRKYAATSTVDYLVANSATSSDTPRMNATATSRLKTRETSPISHRTPFQRVVTSRGLRYLIPDFFLDSGETQNITSQKLILQNFRVIQPGLRRIGGSGRMEVDLFGVGEIDVLASVNGILKSQSVTSCMLQASASTKYPLAQSPTRGKTFTLPAHRPLSFAKTSLK